MSILKRLVNSSSNVLSLFSISTQKSSVNFQLMHFLLWTGGSHQSSNFETFECCTKSKLMSFSKPQVSFSSNFPSLFSVMKDNSSVLFSSNIIYFGHKKPINVHISEIFDCSGQNLSNSSCQFWNEKSVPLQIFCHSSVSVHINPL